MKNPDLMTPTEVIECVIRAAEKARIDYGLKWDVNGEGHKLLDTNLFIQTLKDELV